MPFTKAQYLQINHEGTGVHFICLYRLETLKFNQWKNACKLEHTNASLFAAVVVSDDANVVFIDWLYWQFDVSLKNEPHIEYRISREIRNVFVIFQSCKTVFLSLSFSPLVCSNRWHWVSRIRCNCSYDSMLFFVAHFLCCYVHWHFLLVITFQFMAKWQLNGMFYKTCRIRLICAHAIALAHSHSKLYARSRQ